MTTDLESYAESLARGVEAAEKAGYAGGRVVNQAKGSVSAPLPQTAVESDWSPEDIAAAWYGVGELVSERYGVKELSREEALKLGKAWAPFTNKLSDKVLGKLSEESRLLIAATLVTAQVAAPRVRDYMQQKAEREAQDKDQLGIPFDSSEKDNG